MPLTKVTAGIIAANAVNESFGSQSITGDKLGLTAINANNIVGGAVTGDKLGLTAINANNIVNATITGAKLVANTVSGDVIGQNAISSNNIVSVNASVATVGTLPKARLPSNSVLQVVSTTKTDKFTTTSSSAVDITGLSVTITPTSASSKILIMTDINYSGDANLYGAFFVVRNSTNVVVGTYPTGNQTAATFGAGVVSDTYKNYSASHTYLDSPNTTSAITYKVQVLSPYNSLTLTVNAPYATVDAAYIIGGTSTITVMEIAG